VFPHEVEKLLTGEHLPRRARQDQQKPQLGGGQRNLTASLAHDQRISVDHQLAVRFCRRASRGHPAQHRTDPRIEHPRLHGFHHVIVGSGFQAPHDVKVIAARSQHDDRDIAVAAQPSAHLEAVQPRQHHIKHDDVHRRLADPVKRRLTGRGGMHTITETAQSQLQTLPGTRIVLDQQHGSHRLTICRRRSERHSRATARPPQYLSRAYPDGAAPMSRGYGPTVTTVSQALQLCPN
jgi:hypothetical protein